MLAGISRWSPIVVVAMEKIITALLVIGSLAAILFATTFFLPVRVFSRMTLTIQQPVYEGEDVRVTIDYCKRWDWIADEVRWTLRDGVELGVPRVPTVSLRRGCHVDVVYVPATEHMTPGRYTLVALWIFRPFPWRLVPEEQSSEPFMVVKR